MAFEISDISAFPCSRRSFYGHLCRYVPVVTLATVMEDSICTSRQIERTQDSKRCVHLFILITHEYAEMQKLVALFFINKSWI